MKFGKLADLVKTTKMKKKLLKESSNVYEYFNKRFVNFQAHQNFPLPINTFNLNQIRKINQMLDILITHYNLIIQFIKTQVIFAKYTKQNFSHNNSIDFPKKYFFYMEINRNFKNQE